jgi:uncharacterized protein YqjF (DUF2071 family)
MAGVFLSAEWRSLAILNYRVSPALLKPHVPPGTELDLFDGAAYVSVVGFQFRNTKLLGIPVPRYRSFDEINLRFYVRREVDGEVRHGVTFLRELVPKRAVAILARLAYNEPYRRVSMQSAFGLMGPAGRPLAVAYAWHTRRGAAWNRVWLEPRGDALVAAPGSEEAFITQHFWGYTRTRFGGTIEYEVKHPKWRVWSVSRSLVEGDTSDVFGAPFARILKEPPHSAMYCGGSPVTVHRPTKIRA